MPAGDKIQFDIEADDLFSAVLDKLIKGLTEANRYAEGFSKTNKYDVQHALDVTIKGFKELTRSINLNQAEAERLSEVYKQVSIESSVVGKKIREALSGGQVDAEKLGKTLEFNVTRTFDEMNTAIKIAERGLERTGDASQVMIKSIGGWAAASKGLVQYQKQQTDSMKALTEAGKEALSQGKDQIEVTNKQSDAEKAKKAVIKKVKEEVTEQHKAQQTGAKKSTDDIDRLLRLMRDYDNILTSIKSKLGTAHRYDIDKKIGSEIMPQVTGAMSSGDPKQIQGAMGLLQSEMQTLLHIRRQINEEAKEEQAILKANAAIEKQRNAKRQADNKLAIKGIRARIKAEETLNAANKKYSDQVIEDQNKRFLSARDSNDKTVRDKLKNIQKRIKAEQKYSDQVIEDQNKRFLSARDSNDKQVRDKLKTIERERKAEQKYSDQVIEDQNKRFLSARDSNDKQVRDKLKTIERERKAELEAYNKQIDQDNKIAVKARDINDKRTLARIKNIDRIRRAEEKLNQIILKYRATVSRIDKMGGQQHTQGALFKDAKFNDRGMIKSDDYITKLVKSGNVQKLISLISKLSDENKSLLGTEKQLADAQKKRLERVKLSVQYQAKFGGKAIADQKQLAIAMRRYANAAREAGASTKEMSAMMDQLRQSSKRARAETQRLEKVNKQQSDTFSKLVKDLSRVNVQYFTYTNILHDLEFGVDATARVIRRMTASIIEAAGEMEKFERTVRATEASAAAGDRRLSHLIQIGIDLVGISTQAIIKYNSQLRAAGVSAKEVDIIITGVTKSIAQLGKGTAEAERVLRQISQAIAGNKLVLQDLRPILEEVPTFWARATQTFGVVIRDIETFRQHLDSIGVEKARGLIEVLTTLHKYSQGADMSTYSAQIELLTDQFEVMKAEIGKGLLPVVMIITDAMKGWLNIIRSMPTWVKSAIGVIIGLANVFTLFSGAITAAIALITIWHVKLGLNIVTNYIKNLTAGAVAAQAAGKALDAAQMSARALSITLLRGAGIIGIAASAVIGLGIAFANMQTSTKEAKNALEDIEDVIGDINKNILVEQTLKQIKTSLEDQLDEVKRAGQEFSRTGKDFAAIAAEQILFIENITSGNLQKIRSAVTTRTETLTKEANRLESILERMRANYAGVEEGKVARSIVKRYTTYESDLMKIKSALDSVGIAEKFYTAAQSSRDLEYEIKSLEYEIQNLDRAFKKSDSPGQMRGLAVNMARLAQEIREKELEQEDLSKSDKLAINQKYYEEIRNIAEDLNKSLTKYYHDDYESHKKYTKHKIDIMLDFRKEREKGVKDRNKWEEDRTKEHLKRIRTIQKDAQKDFSKDFKEAQEKYSPANMLRYMFENQRDMMTYGFDKTGKNIAGALKNQQGGFVKQFQEALRIKDVEQRNQKLISLASDLQNRLDNITTLTEAEKLAIVKEYSAKTQELWFAEVQAYRSYQQVRVKDHKDAVEQIHAEEIALNARQDSIDADIAEKGKKHAEDLRDWEYKVNEKGWDAIRKLRDKKEKEYEKQFKKMSNLQRKFANDMIGATLDLLFEQKSTFKEVVLAFIKSSLRIIAQSYIETEIRISNERRVQAAMAETQLFQIGTMQKTAQSALATKSQIESLFNMFKGSLGGGGIAMAGASILAPGAFSNALGGASKDIGGGIVDMLGRGVDGLLSDFSETIRKNFGVFDSYKNDMYAGKHGEKMAYDIIKSKATQSAEDQQRHFDKNFRGKFDELIGSLGNISSGSGDTIVNVYVSMDSKDVAAEVHYEIQAMLDERRLTSRSG